MRSLDRAIRSERAAAAATASRPALDRGSNTDARKPTSTNADARTFKAVRELIGMGEEVWITVTGRSMEPTLRPGDRVLLRPLTGAWRSGRVVLSEFLGRPVLHRLIRVGGAEATTGGDACRFQDPPVPHSVIVGEAVAVKTGSSIVALRPTLRFGVRALVLYALMTGRQIARRLFWRLTAKLRAAFPRGGT